MLYNNKPSATVKVPNMYSYLDGFSHLTGQGVTRENLAELPATYGFSLRVSKGDVPVISKSYVPCPAVEKMISSDHIADCGTLTATELKTRYPREYTSHRNMKNRRSMKGAAIHPDFEDFRSFLRIVGPMPAQGATLDRIHNDDPEYAPGKVRWADKRTQNANKGDSLIFHDHSTGKTYTTSQLAAIHGYAPDTIRKWRVRGGWTDAEIIRGFRDQSGSAVSGEKLAQVRAFPTQKAASPVRELSGAEREFLATAQIYREQREQDGTEAFIPTYEFLLAEFFDNASLRFTPAMYEKRFQELWPNHRDHVNFGNIDEDQRKLIARIDPAYVKLWNGKKKSSAELAEIL